MKTNVLKNIGLFGIAAIFSIGLMFYIKAPTFSPGPTPYYMKSEKLKAKERDQ